MIFNDRPPSGEPDGGRKQENESQKRTTNNSDHKKKLIGKTALMALLTLAITPTPNAGAADSADRAKAAKAKMDTTRTEVSKIRHQVALTLEELNRLQKENVDLRTQFKKFSDELAKMEVQAKVARDRVFSMEDKGQAFFQAWEDDIKSISNETIREEALKRYGKRAKSYGKILRAMLDARDQLKPFMSGLNDIKTLLDSELTRSSVSSTKAIIKQANYHGADVVESLEDVEKELDRVSAELGKYE
jgi:chromosome segregation ATPase